MRSGTKSTGNEMWLHFDLAEKYAGQSFTLLHKKADGSIETFYATADANGDLAFGPLHELSPFMLVNGTLARSFMASAEVPKTGESAALSAWAIMAMAAAAGAASLRRRNSHR